MCAEDGSSLQPYQLVHRLAQPSSLPWYSAGPAPRPPLCVGGTWLAAAGSSAKADEQQAAPLAEAAKTPGEHLVSGTWTFRGYFGLEFMAPVFDPDEAEHH